MAACIDCDLMYLPDDLNACPLCEGPLVPDSDAIELCPDCGEPDAWEQHADWCPRLEGGGMPNIPPRKA